MPRALEMLFCYFSITCLVATTLTRAQVAYSRVLPYDPRYLLRRVPVRRSADIEPRLRLPIARYFPQVDNQLVPSAYIAQEPTAYQLSNGELYAVPAKWQEEVVPVAQLERNDDPDYDNYEYESDFAPVYAGVYPNEVYGGPPMQEELQEPEGDLYNDLMVNYLFGETQPRMDQDDIMDIQRRSQGGAQQYTEETAKKATNETAAAAPIPTTTTSPVAPESSSSAPATSFQAIVAELTPAPELTSKKTTVAVPQVLPYNSYSTNNRFPMPKGVWRDFDPEVRGQKEIPQYRPTHVTYAKSPMSSLEEQLARAKNSVPNKNAFPLLEKILAAQRNKDPLTEQLDNLKLRTM